MMRHTIDIMTKKPDQDMALATERKVEAMIVAVTRFMKVLGKMRRKDEKGGFRNVGESEQREQQATHHSE
jgi:hypothetical protein